MSAPVIRNSDSDQECIAMLKVCDDLSPLISRRVSSSAPAPREFATRAGARDSDETGTVVAPRPS